jgi:S-adenosylmethionine:tRNA ribosyltransferase-isomerase
VSDLASLSSYDYHLPLERIAHAPANPRDSSRLLVVDRARGTIEHRTFRDLPEYVTADDLLVANNTRVMKARLLGQRVLSDGTLGGKIEMLLLGRRRDLETDSRTCWEGAFHSSAKQAPGLRFRVVAPDGNDVVGELVRGAADSPAGTVVARFERDPLLAEAGSLPLPHYIDRRGETARIEATADETSYQTVYARSGEDGDGSAAAPTAGLHFTPDVLARIRARGGKWTEVTLHVGLGTFRPVKTDDIRAHVMHEERYWIPEGTARDLVEHRKKGGRILAVGTTSVRTLESAFQAETEDFAAGPGSTSIFIYPGGRPIRVVDRLLTNFHLPKSTLLMLVCAFGGRDLILRAYKEAVAREYRFFSYGDAMLIL